MQVRVIVVGRSQSPTVKGDPAPTCVMRSRTLKNSASLAGEREQSVPELNSDAVEQLISLEET